MVCGYMSYLLSKYFYKTYHPQTQWLRTMAIHLAHESVNCLHGSFSVGGAHSVSAVG